MFNADLNTLLLICQVLQSSGIRSTGNPSNFINHNSGKVISRAVNSKNVLEFGEKTRTFKVCNQFTIDHFFEKKKRMFIYRMIVFASSFSVAFLCKGNPKNTFQQCNKLEKQGSFKFRLNKFANMYEISRCLSIM